MALCALDSITIFFFISFTISLNDKIWLKQYLINYFTLMV